MPDTAVQEVNNEVKAAIEEAGATITATGYDANDIANTVSEIEADWPTYVSRFAPRMFAASIRAACSTREGCTRASDLAPARDFAL